MFALTLIPTTCVSVGFVHVCEDINMKQHESFFATTQTF